jgi:sulfatase modifying factor 1
MSETPRRVCRPPILVRGLLSCLPLLASCRDASPSAARAMANTPDAAPPWNPQSREPTPPRGMLWIPEGALIAGTPPGRIPRIADAEMPGEQLVLRGFFIDQFPFPNEEGAIPETGASHARAGASCRERGKRLCTELEWERACKGPRNSSYEYGDRYRPEVCSTGRAPRMLPSGYRTGCRSDFGVRDLHGGVWEWTASRWGRGNSAELFSLRGGNSANGELVGRCANALPKAPETVSSEIGFRCCKGDVNEAKVSLHVETGPVFEARARLEEPVQRQLEELLPPDVREAISAAGPLHFNGVWDWQPLANTPLVVAGGCVGDPPGHRCGVLVAELSPGPAQLLGWFWMGLYPPTVRASKWDARKLWVTGGDRKSFFRLPLSYEWGRVQQAELVRKIPKEPD